MNVLRDVRATVVAAIGLVLAYSVVQGWGWPLLDGNVRAGIVVLGITGLAVCGTSGWAAAAFSFRDPFLIGGAAVGIALLAVGVIGLIVNAMGYLVAMMLLLVLTWLIATVHHIVQATPRARTAPTA